VSKTCTVSVYIKKPVILQLQTCAVPPMPKGISRRRYQQFMMHAYIAGYSKMLWDINATASIRPFAVQSGGFSWYLSKYMAFQFFGMLQAQAKMSIMIAPVHTQIVRPNITKQCRDPQVLTSRCRT
jgi:hypothetical protein